MYSQAHVTRIQGTCTCIRVVVGYMGVLAHLPKFAPELFQNLKSPKSHLPKFAPELFQNLKSPKSHLPKFAPELFQNLKSPKSHLPKFAPELFQNLKIANRRNRKSPKSQIAKIVSLRSLRYISVTESQGCFAILENIPFSVERTQGNLIAIFQKKNSITKDVGN